MSEKTSTLIPGNTEKNLPFEIHTLEWILVNKTELNRIAHRHNYVEIVWVKKGSGTLLLDMAGHDLGDNMLYCIAPGQIHQLTLGSGTEGYMLSFTESALCLGEDDFDLLYRSGLFHMFAHCPNMQIGAEVASEMQEIADKMVKEFGNFYLLRTEIIRRYVKIFLIYLTRQFEGDFQAPMQTRKVELLKKFISLVEKNYRIKKMVKDYAEQLSVTPNYLNEIVKKISGYPAGHHIRQRVVLEAKRQAAYSDVSMKEIAYYLGFEDIAHFSKFFKSVCGMNFTEFKRERVHQMSPSATYQVPVDRMRFKAIG